MGDWWFCLFVCLKLRFRMELWTIERSIFTSDVEIIGISLRELHTCDINILLLFFRRSVAQRIDGLLWLSEHIHVPYAELTIVRNGNDIVRIHGTHNVERVNRIRVSCRERSTLHRCRLRTQIPQHNLPVVQTSQNKILLIWVEFHASNLRLLCS